MSIIPQSVKHNSHVLFYSVSLLLLNLLKKQRHFGHLCTEMSFWDPWFQFYFPLAWGMVMCDNEFET